MRGWIARHWRSGTPPAPIKLDPPTYVIYAAGSLLMMVSFVALWGFDVEWQSYGMESALPPATPSSAGGRDLVEWTWRHHHTSVTFPRAMHLFEGLFLGVIGGGANATTTAEPFDEFGVNNTVDPPKPGVNAAGETIRTQRCRLSVESIHLRDASHTPCPASSMTTRHSDHAETGPSPSGSSSFTSSCWLADGLSPYWASELAIGVDYVLAFAALFVAPTALVAAGGSITWVKKWRRERRRKDDVLPPPPGEGST